MTQDGWLAEHPYLQPLASLHTIVNIAMAEVPVVSPLVPEWDCYAGDFHAGLPLLQSSRAAIDLKPAARTIVLLVEKLASSSSPGTLAEDSRTLHAELCLNCDAPRLAVDWLLYDQTFACSDPGLLRYCGWTALETFLRPLREAFDKWREEEQWLRCYCPMCGSLPAMAHLVGRDSARQRFLLCGRCGTRWRYQRTDCPFCESRNHHRLAVLAIEGEGGLRIDHCEFCGGYLKTYDGEGDEEVLLADWTSIHLDILAQDRGLKRLATSLYEL